MTSESGGARGNIVKRSAKVLILVLATMIVGTVAGLGFLWSNVYTTTGPAISSKPLSVDAAGFVGSRNVGAHYSFTVTVSKQPAVLNTRVSFLLRLVVAWDSPENISCSDVQVTTSSTFGCIGPEAYVGPDGLNRTVLGFGTVPPWASLLWHELGPGVGASTDTFDVVYWAPANYSLFTWAETAWVPTVLSPVFVATTPVSPVSFQVSASGLSDPKVIGLWYPFNITVSRDPAVADAWTEFHIEIDVAWNLTQNISCHQIGIALARQGSASPEPIACEGPATYVAAGGTSYVVVNMWAGWPLYRFDVSQTSLTIPGEVILWGVADYTYFLWAVGGAP